MGVPTAPSRSTLAYANQHRPWQLYQTVFLQLLDRCHGVAASGRRKFRFKNKLLSLDATVIDLCATLYDWAKFRRTKGAIKLHLLLDHDGYLPRFAVITDGKTHELNVARKLRWEPTRAHCRSAVDKRADQLRTVKPVPPIRLAQKGLVIGCSFENSLVTSKSTSGIVTLRTWRVQEMHLERSQRVAVI